MDILKFNGPNESSLNILDSKTSISIVLAAKKSMDEEHLIYLSEVV